MKSFFQNALLALALGVATPAFAVDAPQAESSVNMATALEPGPLPEIAIGDAKGVPVIEYGSATCSHCAHFAHDVWPAFKKDYVDTGKVRYIFREYSRNPLDVAAFILARCKGDDKAYPTIELLLATQDKWAFVDKPLDGLVDVLRAAGFTRDQIMECLKDQPKADAMAKIVQTADKEFSIKGTPTFIINGKEYGGGLTEDELAAILKPLIN